MISRPGSKQWLRLLIMLTVAVVVALLMTYFLSTAQMAEAQTYPSQLLRIVVRDGEGMPLAGIALDLLITGPPHEKFDTCVTDLQGECRLIVPPGAYLVQFTMGWAGRPFIPSEEQNGGRFEDGGFSGFAVYLEPSATEQIVTFVVGQREGQLIPLWDLSRDPTTPPQPFAPSDDPLHPEQGLIGIDLGPLSSGSEAPAVTQVPPAETAQVVISEFLINVPTQQSEAASPAESAPVSTAQPASRTVPAGAFGPALIAMVVILASVVLFSLLWKHLQERRNSKKAGGANG